MKIKGDALKVLKTFPDEFFDCIITDPPYPHLERHRAVGTTTRLVKDWFPTLSMEQIGLIFKEAERTLKKNSPIFVFCNGLALRDMLNTLSKIFEFRQVIVWDKVYLGLGYHFRNRVEFILYYSKGNHRPIKNIANVIRFPWKESYRKPYQIYKILLETSLDLSKENKVIDFFAGSCPLSKACSFFKNIKCFEVDVNFHEKTK